MHSESPLKEDFAFRKRRRVIVLMALILIFTAAIAVLFLLTHGEIKSTYRSDSVVVDEPFEVKINQRLLNIPLDRISITPSIDGRWHIERPMFGENTLRFTHKDSFVADTDYVVSFSDVKRITGVKTELPELKFTTEEAPGISDVSFDTDATLAADGTFKVILSAKNRGLRDLELKTNPKVELTQSVQEDRVFEWRVKDGILPQGKDLSVSLNDRVSGAVLISKKVKVVEEPKLERKPREINFGKTEEAILEFKRPMDIDSAKISFSVEGEGSWHNQTTYGFRPSKVEPNRKYTYMIPKGLRSKEGGILTKDYKGSFSTPGTVRVIGFSPAGKELAQSQQTVRVTFNQPVDKKTAEQNTKVSHGKVRSTAWEGNTLAVTVTSLGVQQTVGVTVSAGVKPVFGLPSVSTFKSSFTTEIPVKKLNVPMYYQQYSQSCEAASVRMALSYKGKGSPSDWSILQKFGYNPRPLDKKTNVWDDPQKQFVGDVKGSQGKGTGWGVYAEPVAKAVRSYGSHALVQYKVSKSFIASNIYKGNPVVLWGIWDETATQKTWKTPEGRTISGPIPMHVRLIVGVKGKEDNPVGFYVHDPITGPTYWTADYAVYNAQRAGAANQAVAIQ